MKTLDESDRARPGGARRPLGRDGLARLADLLVGPPDGWGLERAALASRAVEFALVRGARRLDLVLAPGPARECRLSLRGSRGTLADGEADLLAMLAAAAAGTSFVALAGELGRDALLYSDPDGARAPSRLDRWFRRNDHSADWWKFVYPQWRCLEEKVSLGAHWARINYSTLECRLSNPDPEAPALRFFAEDAPDAGEDGCRNVEAIMTEAEVVGGLTQRRLGRVLEETAREGAPAFIHLNTTCMPELLGDTPAPFLGRVEGELGVPVLWTSKTRPGGPLYAAWIGRRLAAARFAGPRDPRAVLLAGVPSAAARAEAEELLGGLGLRVVGTVFPNLDFSRAPELGAASAVVWLDPVGWETVDDSAFLRHGLAVVRTHPPYGLAGTRAWLDRAASVLGADRGGGAWDAALAARAGALDALRAEARGRVVALAGDRADLELLTAAGGAFGFSVAGLLCELGFRVRCLVRDGGPESARAESERGAGTVEFVPFATPADLDLALGGADLAFTHLNHDARLHARALRGFTEAAFEPGLGGLLRSGRRLLARCAARPFPRHRAFLGGRP